MEPVVIVAGPEPGGGMARQTGCLGSSFAQSALPISASPTGPVDRRSTSDRKRASEFSRAIVASGRTGAAASG